MIQVLARLQERTLSATPTSQVGAGVGDVAACYTDTSSVGDSNSLTGTGTNTYLPSCGVSNIGYVDYD